MIQKVVLPYSLHVCTDTFTDLATELLKCHTFPFCCSLNNLCLHRSIQPQPAREFHGCPRSITIQIIVHTTVLVNDKRNLDHLQIEFIAKVRLNIIFYCKDSFHSFHGRKKGLVILGQLFCQKTVIPYSRPSQVSFFICHLTPPLIGLPFELSCHAKVSFCSNASLRIILII